MANKTEIFGYRYLNETTVRMLAQKWDFSPNETIVRQCAEQAEQVHGTPCIVGGKLHPYWGTDERGYHDAAKLLDGYLEQTAQEAHADAASHDRFCHDAYGA